MDNRGNRGRLRICEEELMLTYVLLWVTRVLHREIRCRECNLLLTEVSQLNYFANYGCPGCGSEKLNWVKRNREHVGGT